MNFWVNVLTAGISNGTALLFATMGELLAERAGVLNLGVEGMMLMGAVTAYGAAAATGDPWLGLLVGMLAGGFLSLLHAFVVISLRADQVVSGLALTFLGTGLALVLGEGLASARGVPTLPTYSIPILDAIPFLGPVLFDNKSVLVFVGYLLIPALWFYIYRTRGGLHLRAVGEYPAAADSLGIDVYALRYFYVFCGGVLAGLAGGAITLSITPGWFSEFTTSGYGWIAIGLVIFAQWNPVRAAIGAYL
ncbi:ABC transporter permease, partial [Anaerolineae bacterium CFX7]|nr:ABC transporter permease [Anaerolineae bacterium CFX7]